MKRNRLVQHLMRHTGLATVQREVEHTTRWAPGSTIGGSGQANVPQAYLWEFPNPENSLPDHLPESEVMPQPQQPNSAPEPWSRPLPTGHAPAPQARKNMPQAAAPVQRRMAGKAGDHSEPRKVNPTTPASSPAVPLQANVTPPAARMQSTPGASSPSQEEDRNWRRLQAIFRKHQEQEAGEEDRKGSDEPAAPATDTAPKNLQSQAVHQNTGPVEAPPEEAGSPEADQIDLPDAAQRASAGIIQLRPAPEDRLNSPESGDQAVFHPGQTGPLEGAQKVRAKALSDPQEAGTPHVADQPGPARPNGMDDRPAAPRETFSPPELDSTPSRSSGENPSAPVQRLPLEAVWPVQKVQKPAETPAPSSGVEPSQAELEQIQGVLMKVSPGQASDSRVELVPTRRPRPAGLPPARPVERQEPSQAMGETQKSVGQDPGSRNAVQDSKESEPGRIDGPQTRSAEEQVMQDAQANPPAPVQRTVEDGGRASGIVHTAAGPLPGDLWSLIGEEPPGHTLQVEHTKTARSTRQSESSQGISLVTGQVQRSVEVDPVESEVSPAQGGPSNQAPTQDSAQVPEVDVDKLAKKVYAEVRRMLNKEWERLRRR